MAQQLTSSPARYKSPVPRRKTLPKNDHISPMMITRLQTELIVVIIPKRSFDGVHLKLPAEHCFLLLLCLEAGEVHLAQLLPVVSLLGVELAVLSLIIKENLLVLKLLRAAFLLLVGDSVMRDDSFDTVLGDGSSGMCDLLGGAGLLVLLEGIL
jgi:hypothetical protein